MEINCKFEYCYVTKIYTCFVHTASITSRGQRIKSFVCEHKTGKSNRDVDMIAFQNTQVHYFPRGLNNIFPNLKHVWIENCGLKEILGDDLKGLEEISDLHVPFNDIKYLRQDLFRGMRNLQHISLNSNKLEFITSKLFERIQRNQLKYVNFQQNQTINAIYNAGQTNPHAPYYNLKELIKLIDTTYKNYWNKPVEPVKSSVQQRLQTRSVAIQIDQQGNDVDSIFVEGFKTFFTSGQFSDFVIIVGDRKFKVHKTILAIRSKFFAKMLAKDEKNVQEMKNEDFSAEAVEEVLRWMYINQAPSELNAIETFALAVELEISALKNVAENLVLKKLNEDNAVDIFDLGILYKSDKLKISAFDEIKRFLDEPDLDEKLIEQTEKLKKLVEIKRSYEELMKTCKKRKLN